MTGVERARSAPDGACLIGLALLFFAPLALAFYLYYGHGTGIRAAASMPAS